MYKIKENLKYIIPISILTIIGIIVVIYYCFNTNNNSNIVVEATNVKEEKNTKEKQEEKYYYVDIKGAINNSGVYKLKENSRVIDVINEAGGLREDANTSTINLSKKIFDEMFIIIYTNEEIEKYKKDTISTQVINENLQKEIVTIDTNNDANIKEETNVSKDNKDEIFININTASKEELLSVSGIGESKADNIIKYRKENGNFEKIEDIKNVTGIGEALFEKIKEHITV